MIPRDRMPRLRYSDLERLAKLLAGLQAIQQSIGRSRVTGAEAMVQSLSELYDLVVEVGMPAQRAVANWEARHAVINPPASEDSGAT